MARTRGRTAEALYFAWRLQTADVDSADRTQDRLKHGEAKNLYELRSWVIVNGTAQALLAPEAPLETIVEALWDEPLAPASSRRVAGTRACAALARRMETAPVTMGLADRPEEWPYSSAARD